LRRRIRRGLLKVEQHALARTSSTGGGAGLNARELWEQINTCSCLNLILACIVYGPIDSPLSAEVGDFVTFAPRY
jgi:hypothetical protein